MGFVIVEGTLKGLIYFLIGKLALVNNEIKYFYKRIS